MTMRKLPSNHQCRQVEGVARVTLHRRRHLPEQCTSFMTGSGRPTIPGRDSIDLEPNEAPPAANRVTVMTSHLQDNFVFADAALKHTLVSFSPAHHISYDDGSHGYGLLSRSARQSA